MGWKVVEGRDKIILPYKPVLVEWTDCMDDSSWLDPRLIDSDLPGIITVGLLIQDLPEVVMVAASYDSMNGNIGYLMKIPKSLIRRINYF